MKLNAIVADKPSSSYVNAMPGPTAFDLSSRRALAASSSNDGERFSMTARAFPGFLYAGNGMRLVGDGPDTFTDIQDEAPPFKSVLRVTPV